MPSKRILCTSLFIVVGAVLLCVGCATPAERQVPAEWDKEPVYVPPFSLDLDEYAIERRGWWFGSEDYMQVDNLGFALSEHLRKELDKRQVSVLNYQEARHFQDRFLAENNFSEDDLTYFDWSRLLGSPYVLMGEVKSGGTAHNRTIHAWYVDLTVEVFFQDVRTGEVLYRKTYEMNEHFQSLAAALQKLSQQISDDIVLKL